MDASSRYSITPTLPPQYRRYSSADVWATTEGPSASSTPVTPTSFDPDSSPELPSTPGEGWRTSYGDFTKKPRSSVRYSQAPSTLASSPSTHALEEAVKEPMISSDDWKENEPREEHRRKSRQRRESVALVGQQTKGFMLRRWKWLAIASLATALVLFIVLFFTIPRAPQVFFATSSAGEPLLSIDNDNATISSNPAQFSFLSDLHVSIDASTSYIPVSYSSFHVELRLFETDELVAQGPRTGLKVRGRKSTVYAIPLTWQASYTNSSDPTYSAIRTACGFIYPTTTRPGLNLTMTVTSTIWGLIGEHTTKQDTVKEVDCPVQFPSNST